MKLVLFMMGYGLDGAELLRYVAFGYYDTARGAYDT